MLLLTHSQDFYTIDRVAQGLERRGQAWLRVDTDRYPLEHSLTVHSRPSGFAVWLDTGARSLRLDASPAVWARRLWPGAAPADMEPRFARACNQASRAALLDALPLLSRTRFVNPVVAGERAESKLLQLSLAQALGFRVPETLVTNAPQAVRALARRHPRLITKLLLPLVQSMQGSPDFMYTSCLRPEDLEALEGLRYAPQIFQPLLPKARELRVIVVGERLFAAGIDARRSRAGRIDWRRASPGEELRWTEERLAPSDAARVRRLMRRLGLVYGALDFIVTPKEELFFLEVNPAGEWGWLERDLGFPIGDALAEELTARRSS